MNSRNLHRFSSFTCANSTTSCVNCVPFCLTVETNKIQLDPKSFDDEEEYLTFTEFNCFNQTQLLSDPSIVMPASKHFVVCLRLLKTTAAIAWLVRKKKKAIIVVLCISLMNFFFPS